MLDFAALDPFKVVLVVSDGRRLDKFERVRINSLDAGLFQLFFGRSSNLRESTAVRP